MHVTSSDAYKFFPTNVTHPFHNAVGRKARAKMKKARQHGQVCEKNAMAAYAASRMNLRVTTSKTVSRDSCYARPDGLIYDPRTASKPSRILEIKCPMKCAKMRDIAANIDKLGWLKRVVRKREPSPYISRCGKWRFDMKFEQGAKYYHQLQGHLYATSLNVAVLFIWGPLCPAGLEIEFNKEPGWRKDMHTLPLSAAKKDGGPTRRIRPVWSQDQEKEAGWGGGGRQKKKKNNKKEKEKREEEGDTTTAKPNRPETNNAKHDGTAAAWLHRGQDRDRVSEVHSGLAREFTSHAETTVTGSDSGDI